eukprot:scaffold889_cov21-Tisochrysis_lutea.AAC.8
MSISTCPHPAHRVHRVCCSIPAAAAAAHTQQAHGAIHLLQHTCIIIIIIVTISPPTCTWGCAAYKHQQQPTHLHTGLHICCSPLTCTWGCARASGYSSGRFVSCLVMTNLSKDTRPSLSRCLTFLYVCVCCTQRHPYLKASPPLSGVCYLRSRQ